MEYTVDFTQGLNTDADHMTCPPHQTTTQLDFYNDYNTLKQRLSSATVSNAALAGTNLIDHVVGWQDPAQVQASNRYIILALSNNKAFTAQWISDSSIEGGTMIAFSDVTNGVAVGKFPATSDVLNGRLVVCTNNAPPVVLTTYNGNIAALGGSPPTCVCVKTVNNMMFMAGTFFNGSTGTFSRVYWSAVSDPTTWPAASNLDFRINDGDYIIALGALGQNLVIFKNNSIGLLSTTTQTVAGTSTLGPLTTLWTGIGGASPCAVDNLPDGRLVFLGSDLCVYITDGTTLQNVSKRPFPASSIFSGISAIWSGPAGQTGFPVLKVYPSKNEVWIIPGANVSGSSSTAFIYDYVKDSWSQTNTPAIQCLGLLDPMRSGPSAGYAYRLIYGTSDTTSRVRMQDATNTPTTSGSVIFSIPLVGELADFIPRSVVIPSNNTNQVSVNFGFDNTIDTNYTYLLSTTAVRNVFPVKYPAQSTAKRPCSFQIKISNALGVSKIYPISISDKVLS